REHRSSETRPAWLNAQQLRLAAAIDDGTILDGSLPVEMSEGGRATLRAFEEDRLRQERLAELRDEAGAATERNVELELTLATESRRRQHVEQVADDVLDRVERNVRAYTGSRTSRMASKLNSVRRTLTPGVRKTVSPLDRVLRDVTGSRQELELSDADTNDPPPAGLKAAARPRGVVNGGGGSRPRRKVAVVAWDVGHNPLGRAHALAGALSRHVDVEIWGAQFKRYGTHASAPLRASQITVRTFPGRDLPDGLVVMERVAGEIDADAIYVSKPRLPSYALGILAKAASNRPLVLDVDDHELAFFDEDEGLHLRDVLARRG